MRAVTVTLLPAKSTRGVAEKDHHCEVEIAATGPIFKLYIGGSLHGLGKITVDTAGNITFDYGSLSISGPVRVQKTITIGKMAAPPTPEIDRAGGSPSPAR
jgi:hypothetical protein